MKTLEVVPPRADDTVKWLKLKLGATLPSSVGFGRQRGEEVAGTHVSVRGIWLVSHSGPGLLDPHGYK